MTQTKPKPSGPKAASSEAANSSASRSNETDDTGKHRKHTDFRCQEVRKAKKDQKGRSRDYLTILPFPNVPAAPESFSSSLQEPGSGSHVRSTQGTSIKKVSCFFLFAKACFIVCILQQYIYHKLYVYIRSKWNAATMTLGCLTGRLEKSDLSEEALLHSTPLLSPATLEANLVRAHASRRWFPIRTRRQYAYLPICYCCLLWSIRLRKS